MESSVIFSLRELRNLESDRVAAEDQARRDAEAARIAQLTAEAEARAARIAEAERAVRDEELRIAQAKEAAARAERIAVEQADAAARAHYQAQLEAERLAQEVALRREEIAKKRPTWMIAVTAIAAVAAGALIWFSVMKQHDSDVANAAADAARVEKANAVAEANAAKARVATLAGELDTLDAQVKAAIKQVAVAQGKADAHDAQLRLEKLQKQQADAAEHLREEKIRIEKQIRSRPVVIDDECKNAALSKKCL